VKTFHLENDVQLERKEKTGQERGREKRAGKKKSEKAVPPIHYGKAHRRGGVTLNREKASTKKPEPGRKTDLG